MAASTSIKRLMMLAMVACLLAMVGVSSGARAAGPDFGFSIGHKDRDGGGALDISIGHNDRDGGHDLNISIGSVHNGSRQHDEDHHDRDGGDDLDLWIHRPGKDHQPKHHQEEHHQHNSSRNQQPNHHQEQHHHQAPHNDSSHRHHQDHQGPVAQQPRQPPRGRPFIQPPPEQNKGDHGIDFWLHIHGRPKATPSPPPAEEEPHHNQNQQELDPERFSLPLPSYSTSISLKSSGVMAGAITMASIAFLI